VTLNFWGNYLIAYWDLYCDSNPCNFRILEFEFESQRLLFKSDNIDDYRRFRSFMQVMDLLLLDLQTFKHEKRKLVAAAFYI